MAAKYIANIVRQLKFWNLFELTESLSYQSLNYQESTVYTRHYSQSTPMSVFHDIPIHFAIYARYITKHVYFYVFIVFCSHLFCTHPMHSHKSRPAEHHDLNSIQLQNDQLLYVRQPFQRTNDVKPSRNFKMQCPKPYACIATISFVMHYPTRSINLAA